MRYDQYGRGSLGHPIRVPSTQLTTILFVFTYGSEYDKKTPAIFYLFIRLFCLEVLASCSSRVGISSIAILRIAGPDMRNK